MDIKEEVVSDLLKEYATHERILAKIRVQLEALGVDTPDKLRAAVDAAMFKNFPAFLHAKAAAN